MIARCKICENDMGTLFGVDVIDYDSLFLVVWSPWFMINQGLSGSILEALFHTQ